MGRIGERMATGVVCGLQNRHGAYTRPGWVRFPHVPAIFLTAVLVTLGGSFAPSTAHAQVQPQEPATPDTTGAVVDSLPPVSPMGALLRSLVIPGWGQTAVDRPARGAIYFAAESASLFMVFKSNSKLSAARKANPPNDDLVEARTNQRENWIVLAAFIAFMSGLDAWVSAHLWDFEPEVSAPEDGSQGIEITYRIPVRFP